MELSLSGLPVFFVFVRVPLCSEFFIGALDVEEGGILVDSEYLVIVFNGLVGGHECNTCVFNYSIVLWMRIYII